MTTYAVTFTRRDGGSKSYRIRVGDPAGSLSGPVNAAREATALLYGDGLDEENYSGLNIVMVEPAR